MTKTLPLSRYNEAIQVLSYIYDSNTTSRAALSLLAHCYFYTQVRGHAQSRINQVSLKDVI